MTQSSTNRRARISIITWTIILKINLAVFAKTLPLGFRCGRLKPRGVPSRLVPRRTPGTGLSEGGLPAAVRSKAQPVGRVVFGHLLPGKVIFSVGCLA